MAARRSLKTKALLALGALAYDALKNPEVQKALKQVASGGVKKAGELVATAQGWWKERQTKEKKEARPEERPPVEAQKRNRRKGTGVPRVRRTAKLKPKK